MNVPLQLLEARESALARQLTPGFEYSFSEQLHARFDPAQNAMWSRWSPTPRPCFNPGLLRDIRAYYDMLTQTHGVVSDGADEHPIEYVVLASAMPGVFNLGGDLDLFRGLIDNRDRAGMSIYGRACVDVLYRNYIAHELAATTISLVQGECLGGGFEAALSSDVIIAERSARFGFPEILFNLFPGMGAYSFLYRRVGEKRGEEILTSGRIYSAEEMRDLGVIDRVVDDGQGETEVAALIKQRSRMRNGLYGIAAARRRVQKIELAELVDIVEIWVDCALRLNTRDLKLMQRLVSRQSGLAESQQMH
ncbi:MAG: crotonase/enoyl-CoA hydratase family protein [Burkholderiales bacterium]|nr:crotonase/enoyl-CoA hydratase family protein [Burkholderiales bacterium]